MMRTSTGGSPRSSGQRTAVKFDAADMGDKENLSGRWSSSKSPSRVSTSSRGRASSSTTTSSASAGGRRSNSGGRSSSTSPSRGNRGKNITRNSVSRSTPNRQLEQRSNNESSVSAQAGGVHLPHKAPAHEHHVTTALGSISDCTPSSPAKQSVLSRAKTICTTRQTVDLSCAETREALHFDDDDPVRLSFASSSGCESAMRPSCASTSRSSDSRFSSGSTGSAAMRMPGGGPDDDDACSRDSTATRSSTTTAARYSDPCAANNDGRLSCGLDGRSSFAIGRDTFGSSYSACSGLSSSVGLTGARGYSSGPLSGRSSSSSSTGHCSSKFGVQYASSSSCSPPPPSSCRTSTTMRPSSVSSFADHYSDCCSTTSYHPGGPNSFPMEGFDPVSQARWVNNVTEALKKRLPKDIEEFDEDNVPTVPAAVFSTGEEEESFDEDSVKVTAELYKKLFHVFGGFQAYEDSNGQLLVANAFDTLLKIRLKRIHLTLLKSYYNNLVEVMSVKYPALLEHVHSRQWAALDCVPLSKSFKDLVGQWKRIQTIEDVLCAPCDNTTYAGVSEYSERQAKEVANAVMNQGVIDEIVHSIAEYEENNDWDTSEKLWRMLHESIVVCVDELSFPTSLINTIHRNKLIGRICKAVCCRNSRDRQLVAATMLEKFTSRDEFREAIVKLICDFPEAFQYLIPPVYDTSSCSVGLQSQQCDSIIALFQGHRGTLFPLLYTMHEHFVAGIETSINPSALMRLLTELVVEDGSSRFGEDYRLFHDIILERIVWRLSVVRNTNQRHHGNHTIPLYQYLAQLLKSNNSLFADKMVELRLPGVLKFARDELARSPRFRNSAIFGSICSLWQLLARQLSASGHQ